MNNNQNFNTNFENIFNIIPFSIIISNQNLIIELLGINRNTLRKKIKELEIKIIKRARR